MTIPWLRYPRTNQERCANCTMLADEYSNNADDRNRDGESYPWVALPTDRERVPDVRLAKAGRIRKRAGRATPTAWDDMTRTVQRSWKASRRTQWK
jgi:hypothetical protein